MELSAVNGLIRLMTAEGSEDQIERFVRIKEDPQSFEDEMIKAGLNEFQRAEMHKELDQYNGCAAMQESFMILSQSLAEYTLKQADNLRKIVAKKQMDDITAQKEFFYNQLEGNTNRVKDYLWEVVIAPSLGWKACPYTPNRLISGVA